MTDVFREVRERVSAQDAARRYGLTFDRRGWCLCPFHQDRHPSMSFKGARYRCWSCGANGDAVDLVRHLYGITYWEAAGRINEDFSLNLLCTPTDKKEVQERQRLKELHRRFEEWRERTINELNAAIRVANLADWDHLTPQEEEAIRRKDQLEHWSDTLAHGPDEEQIQLFKDRKQVKTLTETILSDMLTSSNGG